jgi:hypothetical protein
MGLGVGPSMLKGFTMRTNVVTAVLVLGLSVAACATPYQPQTSRNRYGYRELPITDEVYFLEFQGNVYTDVVTAADYWNRRAGEICRRTMQVPREIYSDPLLRQRRNESIWSLFRGGFLFYKGDPVGAAGDRHSRSGYFRCIAQAEP